MGNRWQRVWGVSWGLLGLWSTSWPSLWWCSTRESYLLFFAVMCKTKLSYYRDVRYTVMILFIICQLVCVTDPRAHMSLVHSILFLKLGVTKNIALWSIESISIFHHMNLRLAYMWILESCGILNSKPNSLMWPGRRRTLKIKAYRRIGVLRQV